MLLKNAKFVLLKNMLLKNATSTNQRKKYFYIFRVFPHVHWIEKIKINYYTSITSILLLITIILLLLNTSKFLY